MKRQMKRRKGETLGVWRERIAPMMVGMSADEIREVLHEVSVASYIEGSRALAEIQRKFK